MFENETLLNDQELIEHNCKYYSPENFMHSYGLDSKFQCTDRRNVNTNTHFSLLHVNARSLNKNFDDLELLHSSINHFAFSVICISETWLNSNSPPMFHIPNYNFIRADRAIGKGGGVGIYINNLLKFKRRPDIHIQGSEHLFIEIINDKNKNIIIGTSQFINLQTIVTKSF